MIKRRCWKLTTERLAIPVEHQGPLAPGWPEGDEGTAYYWTKDQAVTVADLDLEAGGQPTLVLLRMTELRNGKPVLVIDKRWRFVEDIRTRMQQLNLDALEIARRRKVSLSTAWRWIRGYAAPSPKHMSGLRRMFAAMEANMKKDTES